MNSQAWVISGVAAVLAVAVLVLAIGGERGGASAEPGPNGEQTVTPIRVFYSYAVKFVCGEHPDATVDLDDIDSDLDDDDIIFETAINIHNPQNGNVTFAKKGLLLDDGQYAIGPADRVDESLPPDWGLTMDCDDIADLVGYYNGDFEGEGFVIIESPQKLDVVAVYTTVFFQDREGFDNEWDKGEAGGLSMDVEYIEPQQIDRVVLSPTPTETEPPEPTETAPPTETATPTVSPTSTCPPWFPNCQATNN